MDERRLTVTEKVTGKSRTITHTHFKGWPDFEAIVQESEPQFRKLVAEHVDFVLEQVGVLMSDTPEKAQKLLVHCLAGRGRTGTIISIINALVSIKAQLAAGIDLADVKLSIFSIVRRLREQRYWSVQDPSQYQLIYNTIK